MIGFHFVFTAKYRKPLFAMGKVATELRLIVEGECKERGWQIEAMEIMPDHMHLYIKVPRTIAPPQIAQALKGISSRRLRQHLSYLKGVEAKHFWARGYFVKSVGDADESKIIRYIKLQKAAWNKAHPEAKL